MLSDYLIYQQVTQTTRVNSVSNEIRINRGCDTSAWSLVSLARSGITPYIADVHSRATTMMNETASSIGLRHRANPSLPEKASCFLKVVSHMFKRP